MGLITINVAEWVLDIAVIWLALKLTDKFLTFCKKINNKNK